MSKISTNVWTTLAAIASVVIPYLLIQTDVPLPPLVKVIITAANLGLVVLSKTSGTTQVPVADISSPIQTPAGDTATVAPVDAKSGVH